MRRGGAAELPYKRKAPEAHTDAVIVIPVRPGLLPQTSPRSFCMFKKTLQQKRVPVVLSVYIDQATTGSAARPSADTAAGRAPPAAPRASPAAALARSPGACAAAGACRARRRRPAAQARARAPSCGLLRLHAAGWAAAGDCHRCVFNLLKSRPH
jgi:hypothetical protein